MRNVQPVHHRRTLSLSTAISAFSPADVLSFWFSPPAEDGNLVRAQRRLWWGKDSAVDNTIRERFTQRLDEAAAGRHDHWSDSPLGGLALILLFDQFPRNIYRDSPEAFAHDARARRLAIDGIEIRADQALSPLERVFFYLPLEHAESLELQERSVSLFGALASAVPEAERETFRGYTDYAIRHRDIIARFGRFPHRNRILGRHSTPEETEFLTQPGSSF